MSSKRKSGREAAKAPQTARATARPTTSRPDPSRSASRRPWVLLGSGLAVALVVIVIGWTALLGQPGSGSPAGTGGTQGTVVQAKGGQWTNITPDTLASMLGTKDFTLLNVKAPYVGEIAGTDLYIPYTDLAARAAELPADKAARIVVYCRSGHESAIAAQALLDLGYTNIDNLNGGMAAWTASGRPLVQLNHT